jgi:hypothetical protein
MKSLRGYLKHNRNIDKEFIIFGVGARKSWFMGIKILLDWII